MTVVSTKDLSKHFRTSFTFRKILALTDLNLEIDQGEVFGYLGPNGAGKTTTFKLLMGLIRPSRGQVSFWGNHCLNVKLKARIGFLPESPYFYNYLKAREYLFFSGQLFGLSRRACNQSVDALLELVGLTAHQNKLIKQYSKGMLQRLGLAQTLINDPELLILDEPMSGLDPLGRKEVRDIIMHLKEQGKTIIFSTHILSDVEMVCDRVGIIFNGKMSACGPLDELLSPKVNSLELCIRNLPQETIAQVQGNNLPVVQRGNEIFITVEQNQARGLLSFFLDKGGELVSFTPRKESLEDIYVNEIMAGRSGG